MAVQVDSPGQIQDFLEILKRRKWQVLLPIAYTLSLGVCFAVLVPRKYKCTTEVELRTLYLEGATGSRALAISTIEADNAPQQIMSLQRIRQVIDELEWTDYLRLTPQEQNEFLIDVRKDLSVTIPRKDSNAGSTFVTINYLDVNPNRAFQFLRELRKAWIDEVVERDRDQVAFEYENLLEHQAEEERQHQKLQQELAQLKKEYDLSPTQPGPGANQTRSEDPTYARYTQATMDIGALELELKEAQAAVKRLEEELAEVEEWVPETELIEGETFGTKISDLRAERADLLIKLETEGYRPAHTRYRAIEKEITKIDEAIRELEGEVVESEERTNFSKNPLWEELDKELIDARLAANAVRDRRDALQELLRQDGERNRERQEVYRRQRELEQDTLEAQARLSELALKLQTKRVQRDLLTGPTGNPFTITQEPVPPTRPSEPNPFLIIAFSLVGGAALGLGSAVLREFSKSSFRSPSDVARVMVVPVLGVIGEIVTHAQRRRRRLQRRAVGLSTAALLGSLLFLTWAWAVKPDLLTPGLKDGIEELRTLFR